MPKNEKQLVLLNGALGQPVSGLIGSESATLVLAVMLSSIITHKVWKQEDAYAIIWSRSNLMRDVERKRTESQKNSLARTTSNLS